MSAESPDCHAFPRITFGIIVLNGEPFNTFNLRALYPHAHKIIVVEGAAPGARSIASADGHSVDETLAVLRRFKEQEDPEGKVQIVVAEDEGHADGFWPGEKHEQARAFARRATGDFLWQVDIDEFYRPADMASVRQYLRENPDTAGATFRQMTFWGGPDVVVDGLYLRRGAGNYHRLFRWGEGYRYDTHRPPTVLNASGQNLRATKDWLEVSKTLNLGWKLFHYSLLFRQQVADKCTYYAEAEWSAREDAMAWYESDFLGLRRPFRVHNVYDHLSWLEPYDSVHPPAPAEMLEHAANTGTLTRGTEDARTMMSTASYRAGRTCLKGLSSVDRFLRAGFRLVRRGRWSE